MDSSAPLSALLDVLGCDSIGLSAEASGLVGSSASWSASEIIKHEFSHNHVLGPAGTNSIGDADKQGGSTA